jgi:hypothetical protein
MRRLLLGNLILDAALASDVIGNDRPAGSAKLRPTPTYHRKTPTTAVDYERLRLAEAKRARKAAKHADGGHG